MKHKNSNLPVDPRNWSEMKRTFPGLKEAARGPIKTKLLSIKDIRILDIEANHTDSMRLLKENGLRPMTYMEAINAMVHNSQLKNKLIGKCFYTNEVGTDKQGEYTIKPGGNLVKGSTLNPENDISFTKGPNPLSVIVESMDTHHLWCSRFEVNAQRGPETYSCVVVGIPDESLAFKPG